MMTRRALLALAAAPPHSAAVGRLPLVLRCAPDNDLYRALAASGIGCRRAGTAAEAIRAAPQGGGVALLADRYPDRLTALNSTLLAEAAARSLRVFVEYPAWLPGIPIGAPRDAQWERAVVVSGAFGAALPRLRILAPHGCRFVPVQARGMDLALARVAGFDTAVYGLPRSGAYPLLFEHSAGPLLVAATKLSQFVTARYAPAADWGTVWQRILEWLCPGNRIPRLRWTPSVTPSLGRGAPLPAGAERQAFARGVTWFARARLFPAPGDGSTGVMEGLSSAIRYDGSQPVNRTLRADCIGEVSMALAFSQNRAAAARLNDFLYFHSPLGLGPRADPASPSYGLLGWSLPDSAGVYYGDDNARAMLGTMAAAALLRDSRWDARLLLCLEANLRTTGARGFRRNRLEEPQLRQFGWRHFFEEDSVSFAPHYQAYLWACFLWAFHKTRRAPFLERTRTAIRLTMAAYPGQWHWTNGIQQERARMLLPLAWLVRLEDTAEHRGWLRHMAGELLAAQDACGAIREQIGAPGTGSYWPPKSNQEYGTREAPLLQQNGDPVTDALYTSNFAFLGLHEAAHATGDAFYAQAEDRLAQYLCRIQVRSGARPELEGAWFRAFDYGRWEYWASSADLGWGAWSVESGWTQAWICAVLALRHLNTSFWELTAASRIPVGQAHGLSGRSTIAFMASRQR